MVKRRLADSAFTGEGARLYGGRWNSPGRALIYLGATPAISALEVLVHNPRPELLTHSFVIIEALLPEDTVLDLDTASLVVGWNDPIDTTTANRIGDEWLGSGASLVLRVPSAVLPLEYNLLVNPAHPRFSDIRVEEQRPFALDRRLSPSSE